MFRLRRAGPRGFHTTRHVVRMRRHTRVPRPSATVQLVFHNAMLRSCPLSDDGLLKTRCPKGSLVGTPHCVFLFLRSIVLRLRGGFGLPCESEEGAGVIFFISFCSLGPCDGCDNLIRGWHVQKCVCFYCFLLFLFGRGRRF